MSGAIRVAIASYDLQLIYTMVPFFTREGSFAQVQSYQRARDLLRELEEEVAFDVIIVDEYLQDMDAVSFVEAFHAHTFHPRPIVFAFCSQRRIGGASAMLAQGADQCLMKPIQFRSLVQRIKQCCVPQSSSFEDACKSLLTEWGISLSEIGTLYLTQAVLVAEQSNEKLAIRKEIMEGVARLNGVSTVAVDSGLRRVIKHAEAIATPQYLAFKAHVSLPSKVTTGALIYAIKRYIEKDYLEQVAQAVR